MVNCEACGGPSVNKVFAGGVHVNTLLGSRCRRLPEKLHNEPAYQDLKKMIEDFNACCPLLELMAHKSMKPRHWKQLSETIKHHFDVESELFSLRNIMEAPLLENKEDIEVCNFMSFYQFDLYCLWVEKK